MRAGQCKLRERVMVEGGGLPSDRRVAILAVLRNARLNVIGVARALVILDVTRYAGRLRACEFSSHVAVGALQSRVGPGQRKAGNLRVIELGADPRIHPMTLLAGHRERGGDVVRAGRPLKIVHMAGIALRLQSLELSCRGAPMTGGAVQRRVRAQQGKSVEVILNGLNGHFPAGHGVALLAIRPHLAPMNIRVAVRASCADVGEHGLGMALRASHTLVHSAERVTSRLMIELGNTTDGFPACRGVTVLAGDSNGAVGISRDG